MKEIGHSDSDFNSVRTEPSEAKKSMCALEVDNVRDTSQTSKLWAYTRGFAYINNSYHLFS